MLPPASSSDLPCSTLPPLGPGTVEQVEQPVEQAWNSRTLDAQNRRPRGPRADPNGGTGSETRPEQAVPPGSFGKAGVEQTGGELRIGSRCLAFRCSPWQVTHPEAARGTPPAHPLSPPSLPPAALPADGRSRAPAGALSHSGNGASAVSEQEDVIRAAGAHHILLAVSPSGLNRF